MEVVTHKTIVHFRQPGQIEYLEDTITQTVRDAVSVNTN